jgi:hypothetical protein
VERSTRKPVSLLELSVHERLIWVVLIELASSEDGAAGSVARVVAAAVEE